MISASSASGRVGRSVGILLSCVWIRKEALFQHSMCCVVAVLRMGRVFDG